MLSPEQSWLFIPVNTNTSTSILIMQKCDNPRDCKLTSIIINMLTAMHFTSFYIDNNVIINFTELVFSLLFTV